MGDDTAVRLAGLIFAALREASLDPPGVSRASYGIGEQAAHAIAAATAEEIGLEVEADPIGTLSMTLPGEHRDWPPVVIGSHLDAVPHGGNYDGAAGVVLGLALAARLRREGRVLPRDLVVLGIRAEEMCWFPSLYLGSRAAFGLLPPEAPDTLRRTDSGRTLAEHMAELGLIRSSSARAAPRSTRASSTPSSSRISSRDRCWSRPGCRRPSSPASAAASATAPAPRRAPGAHAGAVPREGGRMRCWQSPRWRMRLRNPEGRRKSGGRDLVLTMGECWTDPAVHGADQDPRPGHLQPRYPQRGHGGAGGGRGAAARPGGADRGGARRDDRLRGAAAGAAGADGCAAARGAAGRRGGRRRGGAGDGLRRRA